MPFILTDLVDHHRTALLCLGIALIGISLLRIGRARRQRWRDPVRLFTWAQKRVLIERAGGRCEHKPLLWRRCPEPGSEADHVIPWSRGGPTQLFNGQLLCRRHNRSKSNAMPSAFYCWRLEHRRRRYAPTTSAFRPRDAS